MSREPTAGPGSGSTGGLSNRLLVALVGLGLAWRLVVGSRTVLPREDGVNYLWMAERFAEGAPAAALGEIFSPLLSLLIAVPVALGMAPFAAGQVTLAIVGALAVIPMAKASEALFPGTGTWAALLSFVATRPVMLGAEIYTEPLFLLVGGYAFLFGVRRGFWWCGLLSALAFWIRPEAALIPLAFFFSRRSAAVAFVPLILGIAALAAWRGLCGHGYDPVPKLQFIMAHNVAGETDVVGFALRCLQHLLAIPWLLVEACGVLALLAVYGAFLRRPAALFWMLACAVIVICAYVPRWRFLVNWLFLIAPLAALGLARLPGRRWWVGLVIVANLALALHGGVKPDRIAERRVAEYLRAQLRDGEVLRGDMTRVLYFAGQRPLEPRHFTAEELIETGRSARFVVLRSRRETTPLVRQGLSGHENLRLPRHLHDLALARGITVLVKCD